MRVLTKNAARCRKCGGYIESKYTHDFVTCPCGSISVDGGLSYLRRSGDFEMWVELSEYQEIEVIPHPKSSQKVVTR